MSVDTYSSQFKRGVSQQDYNFIVLPQDQVVKQFLNGLGSEFTTIRITIPLSQAWTSTNIDNLTTVARNHLSLIIGNREVNKCQRDINRPPKPTNLTANPR